MAIVEKGLIIFDSRNVVAVDKRRDILCDLHIRTTVVWVLDIRNDWEPSGSWNFPKRYRREQTFECFPGGVLIRTKAPRQYCRYNFSSQENRIALSDLPWGREARNGCMVAAGG